MNSITKKEENGDSVAMDWNAPLNNDGASKSDKLKKFPLSEGEHSFTVTGLDRGYYSGSARLPACNMATVSFSVDADDGRQSAHEERFYLVDKMAWKISDFFCSIGLMHRGVESIMQWDKIIGTHGNAYFVQKEVNGNNGTFTVNTIDHFIDADAANASTPQVDEDSALPDLE